MRVGGPGLVARCCRVVVVAGAAVAFAVACSSDGSASDPVLRQGRDVYGDRCSSCHGRAGGGGTGPALTGVLDTWPDCADQQEWIALGSEGWKATHGDTYGANDAPITAVMPEHASTLTPDEIAAVAAFERVTYGGGEAAVELAGCGLSTG